MFFFFAFVELYITFGCFDGPVELHKNQRRAFEKDKPYKLLLIKRSMLLEILQQIVYLYPSD